MEQVSAFQFGDVFVDFHGDEADAASGVFFFVFVIRVDEVFIHFLFFQGDFRFLLDDFERLLQNSVEQVVFVVDDFSVEVEDVIVDVVTGTSIVVVVVEVHVSDFVVELVFQVGAPEVGVLKMESPRAVSVVVVVRDGNLEHAIIIIIIIIIVTSVSIVASVSVVVSVVVSNVV